MADYTIQINAKDNTKQTLQNVDKGLDKATKRALMLKGALGLAGVALAGIGAVKGVKNMIDNMDNLAKRARTLGVTTEEAFAKFQIIDDFLSQAGLSAEETDRALVNLNTRIQKGLNGNKAYADTMAKLCDCIFDTNVKMLDTPHFSVAVASAIQNGSIDIEDAQKLLGERVGPKIFAVFDELAQKGTGVAEALGEVAQNTPIVSLETAQQAERFNDILDQLSNVLQKLFIEALTPLMPVLTEFAEKLLANMPGYIESVKAGFEALQPVFDLFSAAVQILHPILEAFFNAFIYGVEQINAFIESLGGVEAVVTSVSETVDAMSIAIVDSFNWLYENSIGVITDLTDKIKGLFDGMGDYLVWGSTVPDMVDDIISEWGRLETETKKKTENIVANTTNDYEKLANAVGINNNAIATSTQTTMESIEQSFTDTLANALSDGKLELRDFEGFFRQTLTTILNEALTKGSGINNALSGMFSGLGGMFGGGGGGGFMNSVIGFGKSLLGGIIPGLATGGPAKAGSPYIIGEQGPELFVPNTSGTVVPNHAMGGASVVFNINAIDTQTGTQFLLDNKQQIVGMIQQAGHRRGKEIF